MTLSMVEAVMLGRRDESEELAHARMPERWPNRELIERASRSRSTICAPTRTAAYGALG